MLLNYTGAMDSQSSSEARAAPFTPSDAGEPAARHPHDVTQIQSGFRGGFGEVVGPTQEPRSWFPRQPTPQGPNPAAANEEGNSAILGLSFPRKLWIILEDVAFTFVHQNDQADMVVIEADLFQTEVLQHRGMDRILKTASKVSSTFDENPPFG